jgi:hypothetical protein
MAYGEPELLFFKYDMQGVMERQRAQIAASERETPRRWIGRNPDGESGRSFIVFNSLVTATRF